jgi:hypothetical protein
MNKWLPGVLFCLLASTLAAAPQQVQVPPTETQDLVTLDKGNIRTTISNWGTIGGLSSYGYPSGEWPKGSGHNYIGEMKYWMGATIARGDTLLASSERDFQPVTSLVSGVETYRIRLSTDPTRYDYDPADTIGQGLERPALGWRVWNPDLQEWVYNNIWDGNSQSYVPGGPASMQESTYRLNDAGLGSELLGLELTQTTYQWNYSYNQDFMFVVLEITNRSENDYTDFAFGLYCDFDIGGLDGTGENGRLGDLVAMDSSLNVAWTYDADGYDPGWGAEVTTGVMGTCYIETPRNMGMTAFRTGQWEAVPTKAPAQYALISQAVFDTSEPPTDQYYIQCTSGINLQKDSTIRIGFALIAGYDQSDFLNKARMAQAVYANHFLGPEPPKPSLARVYAGDKQVRLSWDRTSEASIDPMTGLADFAGYKIYRSTDLGQTWGKLQRHPDGSVGPDYVPLAIWRVDSLSEPIPHTCVDTTLTNGFEYWYSVVAFDKAVETSGTGSLQTAYGVPGSDANAVSATPRNDPAGYYEIEQTLVHQFSGNGSKSDGGLVPLLFDGSQLTGSEYEVGFTEDPFVTTWFVTNKTNGDTLLKDMVDQSGDPASAPIVDGVRLLLHNGERWPSSFSQVAFASGSDTTLRLGMNYGPVGDHFGFDRGGDVHFRSTYQMRFTATGSEGYSFYDDVTPISLPFEVWNVTTNQQVLAEIWHRDTENPGWDPRNRDYIVIVDYPYDGIAHPEAYPYYHTWFFRLDAADTSYRVGDVLEIGGAPVNGSGDKFVYKSPGVDKSVAAASLDWIKVVPNPYISRASWETVEGERKLQFIHLPDRATIRIYSLAGDLIQKLDHQGSGTCDWNLLSENGQGIAPGLYYYQVESDVGKKTGKFAVIK